MNFFIHYLKLSINNFLIYKVKFSLYYDLTLKKFNKNIIMNNFYNPFYKIKYSFY